MEMNERKSDKRKEDYQGIQLKDSIDRECIKEKPVMTFGD